MIKGVDTTQGKCKLREQGFESGSCMVVCEGERTDRACQVSLRWKGNVPFRLIKSAHLSRPEHYFSIYQSGCNFSCKKCHSWYFTRYASGEWMSPKDIGALARDYAKTITYWEPRERATSFHAHDLCLSCGLCVTENVRSPYCPGVLELDQVIPSPQGWGPARNIIGFTGGDLACQPEFYCLASEAHDDGIHRKLTGCSNERILKLPHEMKKKGFVLEVLSLFIPGWVETDQLEEIARILVEVDPQIPYTILAFFPEYQLKEVPSPSFEQMVEAYTRVKETGLNQVRLGNIGIFVRTEEEFLLLKNLLGSRF